MTLKKRKYGKTVSPGIAGGKLSYETGNLQGIGARAEQQDSFTLVNALDEQMYDRFGLMFAVCDGMGGMKGGKTASEKAIYRLREFFAGMDRRGRISEQLKAAVFSASDDIEQALDGDGGSTAVAGIVFHEKLYFACVGDSFLYLYRNGSLYRLNHHHTVCHSLYMKNIRSGSTETQSCREDPEAAALSQFLGMPGLSEIDVTVRPLNLRNEDVLLACSDGVGGVLDESDITEALAWANPQDICRRLEEHIIEQAVPNQDNYTALVVKCKYNALY
ncbi:MAG: SpoIIE family protein phosphatase [Eubacterium sp.]|nr:SpoIIE family protein phosphatase [Eubacterium sp.]